jgi:serine/threonine protein kinase
MMAKILSFHPKTCLYDVEINYTSLQWKNAEVRYLKHLYNSAVQLAMLLGDDTVQFDLKFFHRAKYSGVDFVKYLLEFEVDVELNDLEKFLKILEEKKVVQHVKEKTTLFHVFYTNSNFSLKSLIQNNNFLWFKIVQIETKEIANIDTVVLHYAQKYTELLTAKDLNGRTAVDVATTTNKNALNSLLLWHKRYRILESRPEHASATCFVFKAEDLNSFDGDGAPRRVAIKLMKHKKHFINENNVRNKKFDSEFVIEVIEAFPNETDIDAWPDEIVHDMESMPSNGLFLTKKQAETFFCIVMPLADRNMFTCLKQERFAGRNMQEVAHVFTQLVRCIGHMHDRGVTHGDVKPLNIVRVGLEWKLIDLDASCLIAVDCTGSKCSSAYIPPEAIYIDKTDDGSLVIKKNSSLLAHASFDIWSLGCILYQLCNNDVKSLFAGNQDDNLSVERGEDDSLWSLHAWNDSFKQKKLMKIQNVLAKNLISQLLMKDFSLRPSISRILSHPFLTSKKVTRLIGDKAEFDVFISYRVASDAKHTEKLYNLLTKKGLKVWWDAKCLEPGVDWKEGFCAGLVNSRMFVCLISKDAINNNKNDRQNFSKLTEESPCDNVFLEHRLAIELKKLTLIDVIYPVFIGEIVENRSNDDNATTTTTSSTIIYKRVILEHLLPTTVNCSVKAVENDLKLHMASQCLGDPVETEKTVSSVLTEIVSQDCALVEGDGEIAFNNTAEKIIAKLNEKDSFDEKIKNGGGCMKDIEMIKRKIEENQVKKQALIDQNKELLKKLEKSTVLKSEK